MYDSQSGLADVCRRDGIPCEDAVHVLADERRRETRERYESQALFRAHDKLGRILGRLTGTEHSSLGLHSTRAEDLRKVVASAESADVDASAHIAELESIATCRDTPSGIRSLAALEASFVRSSMVDGVLAGPLDEARRVLSTAPPSEEDTAEGPADAGRKAAQRQQYVNRVFQMGYIMPLWRGIEHLLPEGVSTTRGKMPDALSSVARPDWL